jgi:hypothetical protein
MTRVGHAMKKTGVKWRDIMYMHMMAVASNRSSRT